MDEQLPASGLSKLLMAAFEKRKQLAADPDTNAYRVFNGFYEGCPDFSIDRYGGTAVILWTAKKRSPDPETLHFLSEFCLENLPGVESVLFKNRYDLSAEIKKGVLLAGKQAEQTVREWGVPYPVSLQLNKDCGFYLDSSLLRKWLLENAKGRRVLNTFAYTGSLGDAAAAGGALSVTQTDLNSNYLSSRHSSQEYIIGDFFHVTSTLRRSERLFDLIILDPPFFAKAGRGGKVDPARNVTALINKIRPLAAHNGKIVSISNALFISGKEYLAQIESLCGPWISVSEMIPVPGSYFGYDPISPKELPSDPSPFNHPTKMIVLDVLRKDGRV